MVITEQDEEKLEVVMTKMSVANTEFGYLIKSMERFSFITGLKRLRNLHKNIGNVISIMEDLVDEDSVTPLDES